MHELPHPWAGSRYPPAVPGGTKPRWPQCLLLRHTRAASLPDVRPCAPLVTSWHHPRSTPLALMSLPQGRPRGRSGRLNPKGRWQQDLGAAGMRLHVTHRPAARRKWQCFRCGCSGSHQEGGFPRQGTQTHMQELPDPRRQTNARATGRRGWHNSPRRTHSIWPRQE